MFSWLASNLATVLICAALAAAVAAIVLRHGAQQEKRLLLLRMWLRQLCHERQLPSERLTEKREIRSRNPGSPRFFPGKLA